jgi:hypothetical protein
MNVGIVTEAAQFLFSKFINLIFCTVYLACRWVGLTAGGGAPAPTTAPLIAGIRGPSVQIKDNYKKGISCLLWCMQFISLFWALAFLKKLFMWLSNNLTHKSGVLRPIINQKPYFSRKRNSFYLHFNEKIINTSCVQRLTYCLHIKDNAL